MKLLRWKIVLGLFLVFTAGAVTGAVATHFILKSFFDRSMRFDNWPGAAMKYLDKKLELTPAQHEKVRVIVEESSAQIKSDFKRTMTESGALLLHSLEEIDAELNSSQRATNQALESELRENMRKRLNIDLPEN